MVLTSVDIYYWGNEITDYFTESRIENIYFSQGIFMFKLYKSRNKSKFIYFKPGEFIFLNENKILQAERNGLVEYLRKHIKGGVIKESSVLKGERIFILKIKKGDETLEIIFELFKPGNLIITKEGIIKNLYLKKNFRDRKLLVNEKYVLPPKKELKIKTDKKDNIEAVKYIATRIGIGGKYAEEVIKRANINKEKKITELSKEEIETINNTIDKILNQEIEAYNNHEHTEFYPFKFLSVNTNLKRVSSFNEALKNVYLKIIKKTTSKEKEEIKKKLAKLQERLKKLEERKKEIQKEIEELYNKGNKIYENYSLILEILESAKKGDIRKYKNIIKKYDKKNKIIEIETN